jgi:hypothetical protein
LAPADGCHRSWRVSTSLHQGAEPANAGGRSGSPPSTAPAVRPARPVAGRSGAERVLELARRRGRGGVHSSDFDVAGETADGGPPIRRLAARIDELKRQGHWFTTRKRRDRTAEYVLVRDAAAVELALREASEPRPDPEPERLFDPPPAPAREAALFDWEDAA